MNARVNPPTGRELLLGLVATIPDKECKDMYFLLKEMYEDIDTETGQIDWLYFNRFGFKQDGGIVKLSERQYKCLLNRYGHFKTQECIKILARSLEKGTEVKKNHFHAIVGWVCEYFNKEHKKYEKDYKGYIESRQEFNKVKTKKDAIEFIKAIPKKLRATDTYVQWLIGHYGSDIAVGLL